MNMTAQREFRRAESELAEALTGADRKKGLASPSRDCPSPQELRRFLTGKSTQSDAILAHLGDCPRCARLLGDLRPGPVRVRKIAFALAAMAVVFIVGWLILARPAPIPTGLATIDLRSASPTRGGDNPTTDLVRAQRSNGTVRLLMPIGSEGEYDCEIQSRPGGRVIVKSSGEASVHNQDVVLDLPLNLGQIPSGKYSLALRRIGSDWIYYPLQLN